MNFYLQLQMSNQLSVGAHSNVIFDSGENVEEITLDEPGTYVINWSVNTLFSQDSVPRFAIVGDGIDPIFGTSPLLTGQVSGTAIVEVEDSVGISLKNMSESEIILASDPPFRANLTVFRVHHKILDSVYLEVPQKLGRIEVDETLIFETAPFDGPIAYAADGTITFHQKGTYFVSWLVNVGSSFDANPSFTLQTYVEDELVDELRASSPLITAQVKSSELLVITQKGTTAKLVNTSDAAVIYQASASPAASFRINPI